MNLASIFDDRALRIFNEQTDFDDWPQPGAAAGLFAGFFVGMTILSFYDLKQILAGEITGFEAISNLAIIALLIVPLITGIYAAKLPRDEIRGESFAHSFCAKCPRWVLLQGYLLASLYRMRLTFIFLGAAMPFFATGMISAVLKGAVGSGVVHFETFADVAGLLIFYISFGLSLLLFNILMAAIGTLEGLRGRSWFVTALRVVVPLVFFALTYIVTIFLLGGMMVVPYGQLMPSWRALVIGAAVLLIVYPLLSAYLLVRRRGGAGA